MSKKCVVEVSMERSLLVSRFALSKWSSMGNLRESCVVVAIFYRSRVWSKMLNEATICFFEREMNVGDVGWRT